MNDDLALHVLVIEEDKVLSYITSLNSIKEATKMVKSFNPQNFLYS